MTRRASFPFRLGLEIDSGLGRVSQAGELSKSGDQRHMLPTRVFGKFALVYLLAGSGVYIDPALGTQPVRAGALITVFPTLPHRYGPRRGERWHEVYLVFEGPIFEQWERAGLLDPREPLRHLPAVDLWRQRLASVLEPAPPLTAAGALVEVCRLQQVLADLRQAQEPGARSWLWEAQAVLEQESSLSAAAARMNCASATFRRRFTAAQGLSPGRYRLQQRVRRACELMHRGGLTDKQIAAELGFCDEFHFSRSFKRHVGLSPRDYRRSLP